MKSLFALFSRVIISSVVTFCALFLASGALAVPLHQCVELGDLPYNGYGSTNRCAGKIHVAFCVENPRSMWACGPADKPSRGLYDLGPGKSAPISGFKSDGGGQVHWAVCIYPQMPRNWNLKRRNYDCG